MKSIHLLVATVVLASFAPVGEAGLFDRMICRKDGKRCDCDCVPSYQPPCCRPVIVRPTCRPVYNYQRRCSVLKPPCCNDVCAPAMCCAPTTAACDSCPQQHGCSCGCLAGGPCTCGSGCCDIGCCETGCCNANCCDATSCDGCCPTTSCDLAQLIYESQTACYARHRRRAIHRMSDRYDCKCHPEVMCALIYALNDADERVRTKAADEIGDQLRKNPCCCTPKVVSALTCALADCHWAVRWQAKQALKRCGYRVVKPRPMGCCELACCDTGCCHAGGCGTKGQCAAGAAVKQPLPAVPADLPPSEETPVSTPSPAPVPQQELLSPEPPSAYFQKPVIRQTSGTLSSAKKGLRALLEIFD